MPDGMGCHLPMKLREQNSRSQRKTRIQFSCVPQVAPRHRGNDCQIRWSVSVCSLFIITVASVSSSSDSKTLPLLPWLPKILKKTFVNKQLEPKNTIILGCMPRLVASHRPRTNPTPGEFVAQVFPLEFPQVVRAFHLRISHVILRDVFFGFRGGVALMIVHILLFRLGKHGDRLWHFLFLFLPNILEELPSCMQMTCFIEQRAPHLIIASQHSNLLSRSSACTLVSMSLTRLARRSGTAVGWTMPMSSVLL